MSILSPSPPDFRETLFGLTSQFCFEALCVQGVDRLARDALARSGKLFQRRSPLQPLFIFWFTLGLCIYRRDSIPALFDRLVSALRGRVGSLPLRSVDPSALVHARQRLGPGPFRLFFRSLARSFSTSPTFHGLRVLLVDGVRLDLPDTPDNDRVFGRPRTSRGRAPWPQLSLLVLLDAFKRLPLSVRILRTYRSEKLGARSLFRALRPASLVLMDRGLYSLHLFLLLWQRKAEFLVRAPRCAGLKPPRGHRRSRDYLTVIEGRVPRGPGIPGTRVARITVRVIHYNFRGFRPQRLVTSLLDPAITAEELIALYHQRWDIEIAFKEVKTTLLQTPAGAPRTALRSRAPRGILQEVFALLAAYSLIRNNIATAADVSGVPPGVVGFTDALRTQQRAITQMLSARADGLPRLHQQMLEDLAIAINRRPRRPRRYPRVVKRIQTRFPVKRSKHRQMKPVYFHKSPLCLAEA